MIDRDSFHQAVRALCLDAVPAMEMNEMADVLEEMARGLRLFETFRKTRGFVDAEAALNRPSHD